MKQDPDAIDQKARPATAEPEVLDAKGGPVPDGDGHPPPAKAGVVNVIRRLRRGRWTLTEVYT